MNIFLAVPFSSRIDESGNVEATYRQTVEKLLAGLRQRGHDVYCALEYSEWKMGGNTPPDEEFKHDFEQIDLCDKLLVLMEERVSAGVQIECGYAYARGKAIEVYQIGTPEWSNRTFAQVNGHEIISVHDIDDFATKALGKN
jgi:nucleoside 2-deoxyribosyltransferase